MKVLVYGTKGWVGLYPQRVPNDSRNYGFTQRDTEEARHHPMGGRKSRKHNKQTRKK